MLGLSHPALDTRDLALFRPLRKRLKSRCLVSLPTLVSIFMGREVGLDYENPVRLVPKKKRKRASELTFCDVARVCAGLDGSVPFLSGII